MGWVKRVWVMTPGQAAGDCGTEEWWEERQDEETKMREGKRSARPAVRLQRAALTTCTGGGHGAEEGEGSCACRGCGSKKWCFGLLCVGRGRGGAGSCQRVRGKRVWVPGGLWGRGAGDWRNERTRRAGWRTRRGLERCRGNMIRGKRGAPRLALVHRPTAGAADAGSAANRPTALLVAVGGLVGGPPALPVPSRSSGLGPPGPAASPPVLCLGASRPTTNAFI